MTTQYRLLQEGEMLQEGDEYFVGGTWIPTTRGRNEFALNKSDYIHRRPIPATPSPWIPVAERKPEAPCVLIAFGNERIKNTSWIAQGMSLEVNAFWTHWQPFIAPTPPEPEDEKAFKEWVASRGEESLANNHQAFKAGWEKGRNYEDKVAQTRCKP